MHISDDSYFERRQWGHIGGKPWYCHLWPPACDEDEDEASPPPTTSTARQTSTPKPNIPPPPATTPRTTVPRPTPPAATQPPAAPPATTQSPKPPPRPQPDPSPTSQSPAAPPMPPPPATSTGSPPAQQTTEVSPVVVQPNGPGTETETTPTPTNGGGSGTGTGTGTEDGNGGSENTGYPGSGSENQPGQSGVPTANGPSATIGPGIGGDGNPGAGTGTGGPGSGNGGMSGGGFPPGAIGGIVVGLLLLLALLALLLYRARRTPAVQRMLAPFYKLGGGLRGAHRIDTPGGDGMGRNLISPAPAAAAAASHGRDPESQPEMRQPGYLHPLVVPGAAARHARDSNRISVFTNNSASTGFIPSPVSPLSPASMLSPGAVRTSRPIQEQADPRVLAPATAHMSRGSVSTVSETSGISAALSPGQMAWPMPPGTPPAIQTPEGPQYLNFQQSGETVVRINQPPRSNRRSGGY